MALKKKHSIDQDELLNTSFTTRDALGNLVQVVANQAYNPNNNGPKNVVPASQPSVPNKNNSSQHAFLQRQNTVNAPIVISLTDDDEDTYTVMSARQLMDNSGKMAHFFQ